MLDRRQLLEGAAALTVAAPLRAAAPSTMDDMTVLREALKLHPGLYRYRSPAAVEADLVALDRQWRRDDRLDRRYLALSRFLSTLRCGHSYGNFFNQKKAVAAALFDRPTRLPFHFVWVEEAMVVTDGADVGLAPGTVARSLNGEAPAALRRRLLPYIRADGHNDAKRISLLEVRGDDSIETFDVFQGLLAPPPGGNHRLVVRSPGGRERPLSFAPIGLAARRAQMAAEPADDRAPRWTWAMRGDGIAVLTMPGWALWNSKWDWKTWLDARLDSLGGARGLVVDIRDNEGGEDCGDRLLARLIDRPYEPPRIEQRLRFRRTPPGLDPYLDTWDGSFRTLGVNAEPLPGGFFRRPRSDDALRIEPAGKRLRLPVRVLTSPVNSSATFQFASNVRAIGAGQLVGRPTGGNRRGINGGCFFFVRLPDSGLEFDLPLVGYFPTVPQPDAGLLPDIAAAPTIASIAAGRDLVLEAAVASILRN